MTGAAATATTRTAVRAPGAASRDAVEWQAINWPQAHRVVRRLQVRIVQATQAGRWGKVKALQRLLTHSFSARAVAVKRVTENPGKHTPGVDRVTWNTPAQKAAALHALRPRGYRPQPLRRVYIPKRGSAKMRPLGIPVMADRAMQTLYLLALDPIAEVTSDPNSYGFRRERSPADAIAQCFIVLSNRYAPHWILEGDIRSCFDEISHDWLLAHVPMDTAILRKWLKAGFIDKHALHPTEAGTPQGGPLSPVAANLTLTGLETLLRGRFPQARQTSATKVNLVRFADDFIITGASREVLEDEVKPLVESFLRERGLSLSPEKTVITHIAAGFDFLGQHVRKYGGKLLIKPSKKSVQALLDQVRALAKANRQAKAGNLICQLNPLLRGWAQYHRHVVSKETFAAVDAAVFRTIWQWAKRRHPKKSAHWVRERYFRTQGRRRWVFTGEVADATGTPRTVCLFSALRVPIRRHVKVRAAANPYDPAWEFYFEQRHGATLKHSLTGERRSGYLWEKQGGRCPVCHQPIMPQTGWHVHHRVWRSHGGSNRADNQVLLHPTCHRQVHGQGLTVEKPRPTRGDREARAG
jgi:RNA-directed DNA polymerase